MATSSRQDESLFLTRMPPLQIPAFAEAATRRQAQNNEAPYAMIDRFFVEVTNNGTWSSTAEPKSLSKL